MRVCHSDGYWYYGTLASEEEKKGKFRIAFDDGDVLAVALPHRDIQVLAAGAHGNTVGDTPEQAVFHGSFKKRRAKQQVERYAPQEAGGGKGKSKVDDAVEEESAAATVTERPPIEAVAKMSVRALKAELSARGIDTTGNKAALVARLTEALETPPPEMGGKSPKGGGKGKTKAAAAVEEEPAAKKAAVMPPKGVGKGKAKADTAAEEKPAASTMPPKGGCKKRRGGRGIALPCLPPGEWEEIFFNHMCCHGKEPLARLMHWRAVSRGWRVPLHKSLPMMHRISFPASVTGEDVLRVLGLVAGGNLRLVDMRQCRKLIPSAIEEILHRLHATCPAVIEVDITGCSDQVVLRALSVRALSTFGASALDVHAQLMVLAEGLGSARCPLPVFLNALQDREPRLVFDPAFAPAEGAFFTAQSLWHPKAGVLVECCVADNATAVVDAAVLLGVSFPFGNQDGTRIFDCNKRDSNGQGCLHIVAQQGCPGPLFAVLRSAGADIHAKDRQGNTPLVLACQAENLELASMLTVAGADVSVANEQGDMPLLIACKAGNLGLAKMLKDAGADVSVAAISSNRRSVGVIRGGDTPLLMACRAGNFELAEMLKDAGAKVSVANEQGDTPLLVASAARNLRLATMLRDAGADVSVANKQGETPLLAVLAAGQGNLDLATVLLSWGADAKAVRQDGQGALHLVVQRGCPGPLFAALRSAGADVHAKDKQGNTPLLLACQAGDFELATMLKDAGADVSVANEKGECPLLAAFATGNHECAKLILSWGADAKAVRRDGTGVIALDIHSRLLDVINLALQHGPERMASQSASQSTFDAHALAQAYFSPRNLRRWLLAGSSPRTLALEISALLTYPEVDAGIVKSLECVRYWLHRHEGLRQDTTKWLVPHVVEQLASQEPRAFFQGDEPVAAREKRCRLIKCIELKEEVPSALGHKCRAPVQSSTPVQSVAFSSDGCKLAHTEGAEAVVGCAVSGIESCRLVGHSRAVNAVALNQDGTFVASCSDDNTVRMWNARKGTCEKVFSGHSASVLGIAFAPGDKLLASCSADHSIRLWDVQSGAEVKKFAGHRNSVNGIVFSPDGALLASCSGGTFWHLANMYSCREKGGEGRARARERARERERVCVLGGRGKGLGAKERIRNEIWRP